MTGNFKVPGIVSQTRWSYRNLLKQYADHFKQFKMRCKQWQVFIMLLQMRRVNLLLALGKICPAYSINSFQQSLKQEVKFLSRKKFREIYAGLAEKLLYETDKAVSVFIL